MQILHKIPLVCHRLAYWLVTAFQRLAGTGNLFAQLLENLEFLQFIQILKLLVFGCVLAVELVNCRGVLSCQEMRDVSN